MTSYAVSLANSNFFENRLSQTISNAACCKGGITKKWLRFETYSLILLAYWILIPAIDRLRKVLSDVAPSDAVYHLERCISITRQWEKLCLMAANAKCSESTLGRVEEIRNEWSDLTEDLEIASDPELRDLFEKVAMELGKRQSG